MKVTRGSLSKIGRAAAFVGLLSALLVPICSSGIAGLAAQDVSVRAYLTPGEVGVGRVFVLNVEVTGSQT
ncbi:MAG: hypothetical protein HKO65_19075, partial [Gemmatimonadetes bacterium]|nr:hypothetical protein [Gemmatimonadota bacterium]